MRSLEKLFLSKTQHIFLGISIIIGLAWLFILPPFQAPDENSHFYRAYGVTEGTIMCKNYKGSNAGSFLPSNLLEFTNTLKSNQIRFNYDVKQNPRDVYDSYDLFPNKNSSFQEYVNSCVYSPVPYIPQTLGILIGKLLGGPWIVLFYLGRLFNFVFFVAITYHAIKIIPKLKVLLMLLALMPMTLHQSVSLSPDAITIAVSFIFMAYIMKIKYSYNEIIRGKDLSILITLACIIGVSKITYFPLALLVLLIPRDKYSTWRRYFLFNSSVILGSFAFSVIWVGFTRMVKMNFPVEPVNQINNIIADPLSFIKLLSLSTFRNDTLYSQFFGVFGWLDTPLPLILTIFYFVVLFVVAIQEGDFKKDITIKSEIFNFIVSFSPLFIGNILIGLSLYLNWPQPTNQIIHGVQGRYYIPLALSFFYSMHLLFPVIYRLRKLVLIIFIMSILLISSYFLTVRYYYFGPKYNLLVPFNNNYIAGGIQKDTKVNQSFISNKDSLKGVSIFISTFGQKIITDYEFILYDQNTQKIIRKSKINTVGLLDNRFYNVYFDKVIDAKGKEYSFTIIPLSDKVLTPITLQLSEPGIYSEGDLFINNNLRAEDLVFRLIY
ncbi:DUF2142 domain-containing protein [Paenibacillus sp. A3M_27_13]|uniref:DUF2142 domain-containing protein n=1 Tax=unclassified Paenibacillus TaxID=185978 RepID=UPI000F9B6E6E|nr:DUF2142 domain-containing protein [Paenibacillus sp. A3M_27_13]MCP3745968.1 DUF2142 domain-containing protein [Paenibacillus sp. A3M_27_13]